VFVGTIKVRNLSDGFTARCLSHVAGNCILVSLPGFVRCKLNFGAVKVGLILTLSILDRLSAILLSLSVKTYRTYVDFYCSGMLRFISYQIWVF
jgi:hypothetical protein